MLEISCKIMVIAEEIKALSIDQSEKDGIIPAASVKRINALFAEIDAMREAMICEAEKQVTTQPEYIVFMSALKEFKDSWADMAKDSDDRFGLISHRAIN